MEAKKKFYFIRTVKGINIPIEKIMYFEKKDPPFFKSEPWSTYYRLYTIDNKKHWVSNNKTETFASNLFFF